MSCNSKNHLDECRCTYASCARRGNCRACVRYHRDKNEVPACFFSLEAEKTFDRSVEKLFSDRQID